MKRGVGFAVINSAVNGEKHGNYIVIFFFHVFTFTCVNATPHEEQTNELSREKRFSRTVIQVHGIVACTIYTYVNRNDVKEEKNILRQQIIACEKD